MTRDELKPGTYLVRDPQGDPEFWWKVKVEERDGGLCVASARESRPNWKPLSMFEGYEFKPVMEN